MTPPTVRYLELATAIGPTFLRLRVDLLSHRRSADTYRMREIPLTEGCVTTVDDADAPMFDRYVWSVEKRGGKEYAACYLDPGDLSKCIRMHRLIMKPQPHEVVDHID